MTADHTGPVTQREVARRAGVSPRTVSNVVNNFPYVSAEMRAKVQTALDELGYAPNLMARNLRHGRSGMIALVLPLNVEYFAELTEYLVEEARNRSYLVMIDKTDGNVEYEREVVMASERSALFDGMIFSPARMAAAEFARRQSDQPVVLLGQRIAGDDHDHVMIDNVAAAQEATQHLIDIGRRRIAYVGLLGGKSGGVPSDRVNGYRKALRKARHPVSRKYLINAQGFRRDAGLDAMNRLLDLPEPPDAVFCYNDPLALGAMRAVRQRGLRVPEDVAIVGFDDSEDGRYSTPSLTTISQDKRQVARAAVELLAARIDGSDEPTVTRFADWQLITRESTLGVH